MASILKELKKPYGFVPPTCRIHINAITGKSKISPRCNASWAAPEPSSVVCGESWGSFSESWGCSSEENLRKGVPGSPQEAPRRSKTLLRRPKTPPKTIPRRPKPPRERPKPPPGRPKSGENGDKTAPASEQKVRSPSKRDFSKIVLSLQCGLVL